MSINRSIMFLTILLLAGHALSAQYARTRFFTTLTGDVPFWSEDVMQFDADDHGEYMPLTLRQYSIEMQSTARTVYEASAAQFQEECAAQGDTAELEISFREASVGLVEREIEGSRIFVETTLWYAYGTWRCNAG